MPKHYVNKAAPLLVLGAAALTVALFLSGIATPTFKTPNFSSDEEAVNDFVDIVADQFEKMSRGE